MHSCTCVYLFASTYVRMRLRVCMFASRMYACWPTYVCVYVCIYVVCKYTIIIPAFPASMHVCMDDCMYPYIAPWVHHQPMSKAHLAIIFHASLSCAFPFSTYNFISSLHHYFTSPSHSLFGRPLFVFPFISPNTASFTSLLSSILQMCPNKFNFLSLVRCKMFLLQPILFLISSFMIFCCHLTFRILR